MRPEGQEEIQKAILNQMNTIEGHIHAINRMVETDQQSIEILQKLHAVHASLSVIGKILITQRVHRSLSILEREPHLDMYNSELTRLSNLYSYFLKYQPQVFEEVLVR